MTARVNRTYGTSGNFEFGSKEHREYYFGSQRGPKKTSDAAKRLKASIKAELRKDKAASKKAGKQYAREAVKQGEKDQRTLARILPGGRAYGVKISPHDGRPIGGPDVDAFRAAGWAVWGTGTAPAKVGAGLDARRPVKANPDELDDGYSPIDVQTIADRPDLRSILGPANQARAVLVGCEAGVDAAAVARMQAAGYDVTAAPKRFRDSFQPEQLPARVNPCNSKRRADVYRLKAIIAEVLDTKKPAIDAVQREGVPPISVVYGDRRRGLAHIMQRRNRQHEDDPGCPDGLATLDAMAETLLYGEIRKGRSGRIEFHRGSWLAVVGYDTTKTVQAWVLTAFSMSGGPADAATKGQPRGAATHPGRLDLYSQDGSGGHPHDKPATGKRNGTGQGQTGRDSHRSGSGEDVPMAQHNRTRKAKANPTPAAKSKTADLAGLERVWKTWTGAEPGQRLTLNLDDRGDVPRHVVLLGRVQLLAGAKGAEHFGQTGPFMVTDEHMTRLWLVDVRHRQFQLALTGGVIAYTARKPRHGDKEPVTYVHAWAGKTSAWMAGNVGEIVGRFRLTHRGIEG